MHAKNDRGLLVRSQVYLLPHVLSEIYVHLACRAHCGASISSNGMCCRRDILGSGQQLQLPQDSRQLRTELAVAYARHS